MILFSERFNHWVGINMFSKPSCCCVSSLPRGQRSMCCTEVKTVPITKCWMQGTNLVTVRVVPTSFISRTMHCFVASWRWQVGSNRLPEWHQLFVRQTFHSVTTKRLVSKVLGVTTPASKQWTEVQARLGAREYMHKRQREGDWSKGETRFPQSACILLYRTSSNTGCTADNPSIKKVKNRSGRRGLPSSKIWRQTWADIKFGRAFGTSSNWVARAEQGSRSIRWTYMNGSSTQPSASKALRASSNLQSGMRTCYL